MLGNKVLSVGSPPHLRGKLTKHSISLRDFRITPAPAGKTEKEPHFSPHCQDHPRTCGENFTSYKIVDVTGGSPPHLRGKQKQDSMEISLSRITPAPAGKTNFDSFQSGYLLDHPRTCGENMPASTILSPSQGSPPHLRGKP